MYGGVQFTLTLCLQVRVLWLTEILITSCVGLKKCLFKDNLLRFFFLNQDMHRQKKLPPRPRSLHSRLNDYKVNPTNCQMTNFKEVYQHMFALDDLCLEYKKEFLVDDACCPKFVPYLNSPKLNSACYHSFYNLLTCYSEGLAVTEAMKDDLIKNVTNRDVFLYVFNYLRRQKKFATFPDFRRELKRTWFTGSPCLFQHVFVGIIKNGAVKGLHCLHQLHSEEAKGHLTCTSSIIVQSNLEKVSY